MSDDAEVSEDEVKAVMGKAWTPKLQMVVTATAIYTKRGTVWFRVTSPMGKGVVEHFGKPLASELLESERQEHGRARFEATLAGEPT